MRPKRGGRSTKTWRCVYWATIAGRRTAYRIRLGRFPAVGLAEARAAASAIIKRVERGENPGLEVRQAKRAAANPVGKSFANLLETYLAERRAAGLVGIKEVERELRLDALPKLGTKLARDVTAADIDGVASAIIARDAPAMAFRQVTLIKALYNYALLDRPALGERFGLTANPAERLGRRRRGTCGIYAAPAARTRVLEEDEIATWWKALGASGMSADRQIALRLVLVTAQRPGEVRQIERTEVRLDSEAPLWTIPEHKAKNRRRHLVPLSPLALRLLQQAFEKGHALAFPDRKRPGSPIGKVVLPSAQRNLFRTELASLPPATVHDLRRSAATGMRRIGVPPHVVSQILNHTRTDVTGKHYDHHDGLAERRTALDAWGTHLERIVVRT